MDNKGIVDNNFSINENVEEYNKNNKKKLYAYLINNKTNNNIFLILYILFGIIVGISFLKLKDYEKNQKLKSIIFELY